jgi:hypothetical protein
MKVIGIAGQLGNGKDVVADYLAARLNYDCETDGWKRSAFANAVKETFESAFGVDRDFIESWKRNPEPPPGFTKNVRQSLQFIGDGFRQIRPNIWIEVALRDESKQLIISDSRYINEARAVKAKGGLMIVLYRPGFLNDDPNPSEAQIRPVVEWFAKNLKEGPVPKCMDEPEWLQLYDYFLVNDGTLEDLYTKIDKSLLPWIQGQYES